MSFRKALLTIHLWVGLAAAVLIVLLAATGTLIVFENGIDRLLHPGLLTVAPQGSNLPVVTLTDRLKAAFPGSAPVIFNFEQRPDLAWMAIVNNKKIGMAYINPHTGEVLGSRRSDAYFVFYLHQIHKRLLFGRTGQIIVGYANVCFLVLLMSGIVLWWRRKLVTVRAGSWRLVNFDLHHVSGVFAFVFTLMLTVTGLFMSYPARMSAIFKIPPFESAQPVRPISTPRPGVAPIGPDRALEVARGALPGAEPTYLRMALSPKATYDIGFHFPEDRAPGGQSRVSLDQFTGAALRVESSRTADRGTTLANLIRPIHTGDIYGWPSRIVMALASFSVVGQAITGILIWWPRVFNKRKVTLRRFENETKEPDPVVSSAAVGSSDGSDNRTVVRR